VDRLPRIYLHGAAACHIEIGIQMKKKAQI